MNGTAQATRVDPPQAFSSTYAPRIRTYGNSLLTPVIQPPSQLPPTRTTKRGTISINYAEDGFDDEDFYDSEGPRRPTGLRSLRREEPIVDRLSKLAEPGKEVYAPVHVQGIWRDWMGKSRKILTEKQQHVQCALPLTLIPIRVDVDISSFRPDAPLPTPTNAQNFGIDESLPAYRHPEQTTAFRLKDTFLWNLHEALTTPDHFAKTFVDELDFPADRKAFLVSEIARQVREQLEQYAGIALHPLFHSNSEPSKTLTKSVPIQIASEPSLLIKPSTPIPAPNAPTSDQITATAQQEIPISDIHNPDDTYRCVVQLNVNLLNRLYSDRFEWSLLHPPGLAEIFARQTCADLGLGGEWASAISHSIYEAILRLKKEVCENGGLLGFGELDNDAANGLGAGWRYEPEHLADAWEPKVELLNKEEIEKREGDRERQLRRVRRETARYSSTANVTATDFAPVDVNSEQPMGRGERSKKKRRFRSLSPLARDAESSSVAGYGGGSALTDAERTFWRCKHCMVWGGAVWAVRDGPAGPKSLCHNCGYLWERDKRLPPWNMGLYIAERDAAMTGPIRR